MRRIYACPEQSQSPLTIGNTVRTVYSNRVGTVIRVYPDGSASICWHDKPSDAPDLGHERLPRSILIVVDACATADDARALCIRALRATALAPTDRDALDIVGNALATIAELACHGADIMRNSTGRATHTDRYLAIQENNILLCVACIEDSSREKNERNH